MTSLDPQGQAALLLIEGLMHLLVEKGVVEKEEVCRMIEGVEEIKYEMAENEPVSSWLPSIAILQEIRQSLQAR